MTIVKELNNLSKKVTGKEGKATTDAQAVKFIADNYEGGGSYILPTASADTLGGIKVGENLTITDGVLSATGGGSSVEPILIDVSAEAGRASQAGDEYYEEELTQALATSFENAINILKDDISVPVYFVDNLGGKILANYKDAGTLPKIYCSYQWSEPAVSPDKAKLVFYNICIEDGIIAIVTKRIELD